MSVVAVAEVVADAHAVAVVWLWLVVVVVACFLLLAVVVVVVLRGGYCVMCRVASSSLSLVLSSLCVVGPCRS